MGYIVLLALLAVDLSICVLSIVAGVKVISKGLLFRGGSSSPWSRWSTL